MCHKGLKNLILSFSLLICVSAFGQNTLWQYSSPANLIFDPTVGPNGNVYFGTDDAKIRGLDENGQPMWETKIGGVLTTPIALFEDRLYFGTSAAEIRCYGTDGNMVWTKNLLTNITHPIAVTGERKLFFPTGDGYLHCVDGFGGAILWKKKLGYTVGPPSMAADGTIYVAAENFLHAITQEGNIKWRVDCFNYSEVPITVDSYDNLFYIRGGILDVYDKFGHFMWEAYDDQGSLILVEKQSGVVSGDNAIFVLNGGGDLVCLDVHTGQTNWTFGETCDAYSNVWKPSLAGVPAMDAWGNGIFCDTTGESVYFDDCGRELGWQPTVEGYPGTHVVLSGRKTGGLIIIASGQGKRTILARTHWAPPGGTWSQWQGNAAHLSRRDDPPMVQLDRPLPGETVSSSLLVVASAVDDYNVKSMEVYLNDDMVLKTTSGNINWTTDAYAFADGVYTLSVVAYDYAGNSTVSEVSITIQTPVPVYGLYYPPPLFSWLPNSFDTKYQVDISPDPSFYYVLAKSGTAEHPFKKMLSWQPSQRKWKKILKYAMEQAPDQTVFYWRVMGKYDGEVVRKSFIIDKTK